MRNSCIFSFRHLVLCANKATVSTREKRMHLKHLFVVVQNCFLCFRLSLSLSLIFRGKEWDEIFLNSNYLAGIRHAGINGWLWGTRFGGVLEGKGVCVVRSKDWQNSAASVFPLSKLKSQLHAKSVTNEQDRFSPRTSSPLLLNPFAKRLFSCLRKQYCCMLGVIFTFFTLARFVAQVEFLL